MDNNTAYFAATEILIDMERGQTPSRRIHIPSAQAMAWDGAGEGTNCTLYSDHHGIHSYAELKITGRRVRKHTGGVWGTAARIRFTGDDSAETSGEWHPCVVHG